MPSSSLSAGSPPAMVATDLDGTLVRSDGTVSARTRAALAAVEEAGSTLVLVTGRPPRWMGTVVDDTGHRGLAICANGALVYDLHTERVVEEFPLMPDAAAGLVAALRAELPEIAFAVERGATFGYEPAYGPRWQVSPDTMVGVAEDLVVEPVAKLLARHHELSADELLRRARAAVGDAAEISHSTGEALVEISAAGVSKASALRRLCAERGLLAADVVAFGDMPNDLPMLGWAGWAVAVAGAHPEVVAAADEVTAGNDDDGVAAVLERWFPSA